MEIVGLRNILAYQVSPFIEILYETREYSKEDIERIREEKIDGIINDNPMFVVISKLEEKYGNFTLTIDKDIFDSIDSAIRIITGPFSSKYICSFGCKNLIFVKFDEKDCIDTISLNGCTFLEVCEKYINKCLDTRYLIRYKNANGTGYATSNVREIIFSSGVHVGLINV